jgi:hypothetical protein
MEKSAKGELNLRDVLRGALFGSVGALLPIFGVLATGKFDEKVLVTSLLSFIGTFGAYLIKNFGEGK